jgi:N-ethylmaleimide reductase
MSKLYEPLVLGESKLSNRVVLAPLTRSRSGRDRVPNAMMAEYYTQRSGAGLLISEATVVSEQGIGYSDTPGIYNIAQVEGWKNITSAVHRKDSKIFLQLWHCGRASHSDFHNGKLPVAPSAIGIQGEGVYTPLGKKPHETPRELTIAEIKSIVEDFKFGASRAKEAGFDGVEIHAANGYLIDTFLQSKTNQRQDEYGGSTLKRLRFLEEIIDAVLEIWNKNQVGIRLSPNGVFNDMGSKDFREQFSAAAKLIERKGLVYLHVLDGLAFGFHGLGEAMTLVDFRKLYSGKLMGNCGYTKEAGEKAVDDGRADMIAYGRPYISNPDLLERFKNNWPLNPDAAPSDWYTSSQGAKGYTDFPFYNQKA